MESRIVVSLNATLKERGWPAIRLCGLPLAYARDTESQLERDVESFCAALTEILERLPQNEQELVTAYGKREMGGVPWDAFSGYSYRTKFQAFQEFIGGMGKI